MKLMKRKLNELETLNAYGNCGPCSCSSCGCTSCGCSCSGTTDPRNSGYSVTSHTGLGDNSSRRTGYGNSNNETTGYAR